MSCFHLHPQKRNESFIEGKNACLNNLRYYELLYIILLFCNAKKCHKCKISWFSVYVVFIFSRIDLAHETAKYVLQFEKLKSFQFLIYRRLWKHNVFLSFNSIYIILVGYFYTIICRKISKK